MKLKGLNNYRPLKIPPNEDRAKIVKRSKRLVGGFDWKYDFVFKDTFGRESKPEKRKKDRKKYEKRKS